MQTIKESLQVNSDILLESVIDKHIQILINQLVKLHVKPKDLFDKLKMNAADIDPSRIRVYEDIDKDAMKAIEKAMDENDKYIFAIKKEMVCFIYNSKPSFRNDDYYIWIPTREGHEFGSWSTATENPLWNYRENSKSISRKVKIFEHCDEVWVVDYSSSLRREDTQRKRTNTKWGAWENTPEFYAKVLKDNLERYKTQGALMRMNKGSEFENVMKDVNVFIGQVTAQLLEMNKNMAKGQWGFEYQLNKSMQEINRLAQRILNNVGYVLDSQRDYEENKDYEYGNSDYYIRQYRAYIKEVKELLQDGKQKFELLEEEIKKFKEANK